MATPSGIISTTGVGGLTLGGGLGHLSRKCGLTIDNLLAVDMVLADGSFVIASPEENPDLYWAVRGGGGNFGVVTSFLFRTHPIKMVYAGPTFWPLEQAAEVLRIYRELIVNAPEDINGFPCRASRAYLSRASAREEDVRRGLVLHLLARRSRQGAETDSQLRSARL
jgi:FAD/FMN-containing dehydrogenase